MGVPKGTMPKNPFLPGNPGSTGRKPLSPEVREAKRLTKTTLEEMINKYLWAPIDLLESASKDSQLATAEAWMVAIMLKGRKTGRWDGFEWIAQRLVGKVATEIEVTQKVRAEIESMSDDELIEIAKTKLLPEAK